MISLTDTIKNERSVLYLENSEGDKINLKNTYSIRAIAGTTGFGASAPINNTFFEGANVNEYLGSNFSGKEITISLIIRGKNRHKLQENANNLSRVLYQGISYEKPAPVRLYYAENIHTPKYYIDAVVSGGLDFAYKTGETNNQTYITTDVQLKALSPCFTLETPNTLIIGGGGAYNNGGGLLYPHSFAELRLNTTNTYFNNYIVENTGSYITYPVIKAQTPIRELEVINNDTGDKIHWQSKDNSAVNGLVIDFEMCTIIDELKASRISELILPANFFGLMVGENTISLNANNGAGIVECEFQFFTKQLFTV
jgi:hypothetical protein